MLQQNSRLNIHKRNTLKFPFPEGRGFSAGFVPVLLLPANLRAQNLWESNPFYLILMGVVFLLMVICIAWITRLRKRVKARSEEVEDIKGKYRLLVENTSEGVAVLSGERFIFVNPRMEQIFGRTAAELMSGNSFDFIHPDDRNMVMNRTKKWLNGQGTTTLYPFRILNRAGEVRWLNAINSLINWEGQPAVLELFSDITDNKTALETIKASESRLSLALRATNDALWDWDLEDKSYYFSPRFFTMLGHQPGDFSQSYNTLVNLLHPDDRDETSGLIEAFMTSKNLDDFQKEFRLKNKAGGWSWILSRGKTVRRAPNGNPGRIIGTFIDISDRKEAEKALLQSEEKFSTVFKLAPYSISLNSLSRQVYLDVNDGFTEMYGYTREEVIGKTSLDINCWVDLEDRSRMFHEVLEQGFIDGVDTQMRRKDNSLFEAWLSARSVTISGELCMMVVARDISLRKRTETALRRSEGRYRRLFEGAILGILQVRRDGTILDMNPAFTNMLGYESLQDAFNSINSITEIYQDSDQQRPEILKEIDKFGGKLITEGFFKRKDGSMLNCRVSIWQVNDEQGRDLYLEGVVEDISEQKETQEKLKLQLQRLSSLRMIDLAITGSLNIHESLQVLLSQLLDRLEVDAADIFLMDANTGALTYASGLGFVRRSGQQVSVYEGFDCTFRVAREQELVYCRDLAHDIDFLTVTSDLALEKFVEYVGVPLIIKDAVVGVLEVFNRKPLNADLEWLGFLEAIGGQAAIAIDNATLFENLQQANLDLVLAYDSTIEGWAKALELRDGDTGNHSQRVANMTMAMSQAMGYKGEELQQIRRGALLHDIGKISIPDRILLKNGPLDEDEWEIMRRHPVYALELLKPIHFLNQVAEIPFCHHEKWDGTGYPRGLKGEGIPLPARIFSVVDVWDALSSDRPYRKAWDRDKVIQYIREQSGTHFDPAVVEVFGKIIDIQTYTLSIGD